MFSSIVSSLLHFVKVFVSLEGESSRSEVASATGGLLLGGEAIRGKEGMAAGGTPPPCAASLIA